MVADNFFPNVALHQASWSGSTFASGRVGGVLNAGVWKSKRSSRGSALASRPLRAGRSKRASMNRVMLVWSYVVWPA